MTASVPTASMAGWLRRSLNRDMRHVRRLAVEAEHIEGLFQRGVISRHAHESISREATMLCRSIVRRRECIA